MTTPKSKTKAKPKGKPRKKSSKSSPAPSKNIEVFITLILFFGFIIYGAGQCNKAKVAKDVAENPTENELNEVAFKAKIAQQPVVNTYASAPSNEAAKPVAPQKDNINLPKLEQKQITTTMNQMGTAPGSKQGKSAIAGGIHPVDTLQKYNRLWVTIDQLKLRSQPSLKSAVILQLPLYERVYYLNQQSSFTTKINLGLQVVDKPWFLVQHPNGQKGWAYSAGLDFHKQKNKWAQ